MIFPLLSYERENENLGVQKMGEENIPLECYEFFLTKNKEEQEQILKILHEMDKYKNK